MTLDPRNRAELAAAMLAPADPSLAPGEARCPGPSTADIVSQDALAPPAPLLEESYEFLGNADIGYERYTDPEFYQRELDTVWRRTWQWACREEHVPKVGDHLVYEIGTDSIIIIRTAPDQIKAYVNACLHRGMQLCDPLEPPRNKQFLRCPFHGFTWNLDGSLREVPCRWDFPHIDEAQFKLPEVALATWGGFVFVNLSENPPPLEDYLGVLPAHFESWRLEDRYVQCHTRKRLPANWKMAMEAFLEAFHVLATHPEAIHLVGDANTQYDVFGEHVSRFFHTFGYPSPHLKKAMNEQELYAAMGGGQGSAVGDLQGAGQNEVAQLPAGVSARDAVAAQRRESMSAELGVDLAGVSTSEMLDSIEYFLFPNMCAFPGVSLPMIYRFRPLDVDHCLHEILILRPKPEQGTVPPPATPVDLEIEDSYTEVEGFDPGLGFILDQDTDNLRRQRAGAKASRKPGQTLGNYQEIRIRHFHQTLDRYLR